MARLAPRKGLRSEKAENPRRESDTAGGEAFGSRRPRVPPALWGLCLASAVAGCAYPLGTEETGDDVCAGVSECRDTPVRVSGVPAFVDLSAGWFHTCGLAADGAAWCWGSAVGVGPGDRPSAVPGGHSFIRISSGRYHNCGLTAEGVAHCWTPGDSGGGLCGPADCGETPVAVGTRAYRALAAGAQHTCALDMAGAAWCWGFNWMGEVGSPRFGQTEREPVLVSDTLAFDAISADHGYTCALNEEGALFCWGWGEFGQLGVDVLPACGNDIAGQVFCSHRPVPASTAMRFVRISTGPLHACALTREHRAFCWGDNGQGQLGDDFFGVRLVPGPTLAQDWSAIEPGMGLTCGIDPAGEGHCWGLNKYGQLGTGRPLDISTAPQLVAGGHSFTRLSAGAGHVCGLTGTGEAYCWGDNSRLQLGGS